MDRRGLSVTVVALMMVVMLTTSTTASPGIEAGIMQSPGSEDGQPDADNNTLYLFGNAQLSNCNSKFNNTNAESAEYGEDSRGGNGQLDVKVTCRMEPTLSEDVILAVGEMIEMRFMLNLNGQWTNGQESCNGDCENLNISLAKGGREVAVKEYDSLSDGENQVQWQLPVTEDLAYWNGSQESFTVEFRMAINSQAGQFGVFADDEAVFGLYFTHPNNAPEYNASVTFPILNQTAVDELTGGDGGGGGGGDSGMLPGFTSIIGVGGLAAAALLRRPIDD